jgi:hypothetical protein
VQAHVHGRIFFEQLDKGEIRSLEAAFENVLEIAAGLMRVDQQHKMEARGHGWGEVPMEYHTLRTINRCSEAMGARLTGWMAYERLSAEKICA